MIQKIAILYCLIVSATCMVLHQAPLPLYLPNQYQEQAPTYNFGYKVNNAHPGDFRGRESLQENHQGDAGLGQYSFRQSENIPRAGDYRADDNAGLNAYLNNEGRQSNVAADRYVENINDEARRPNNLGSQHQPWPVPNVQQASPTPVTITQTSVYHQTYSHGHKSWI